jgi:hypothetical protein
MPSPCPAEPGMEQVIPRRDFLRGVLVGAAGGAWAYTDAAIDPGAPLHALSAAARLTRRSVDLPALKPSLEDVRRRDVIGATLGGQCEDVAVEDHEVGGLADLE